MFYLLRRDPTGIHLAEVSNDYASLIGIAENTLRTRDDYTFDYFLKYDYKEHSDIMCNIACDKDGMPYVTVNNDYFTQLSVNDYLRQCMFFVYGRKFDIREWR